MMKGRLAPLLLLAGCLLGQDPYKNAFTPKIVGIELIEPSVPAEDGEIHARVGTEIVVDITTAHPIVVTSVEGAPRTEILLEGDSEPFEVVEQRSDTRWRFRKVLRGTEGNGPKTIRATVANAFRQTANGASDVVLTTDFLPPTAACVLSPRVANTLNQPTFIVTLSERLEGGRPLVTSSSPDVQVDDDPRIVEGQYVYELSGTLGTNVEDYVLRVTGTDLAGNPQSGDSMCEAQDRTGTLLARVPAIPEGQDVVVVATPSVPVEELVDAQPVTVPRARVGAVVTVQVPTVDPIEPSRTTVALSGLELDHLEGNTWAHTLTGSEGEGLKTLDVWLVDAAENTTRLPPRKGVVRFDFTPPAADCVLQPKGANARQEVRFDVFASEALDGVPTVTASHEDVRVDYDTSVGTQHRFRVRLEEPGNADYVLTVEGRDLAGNPPSGPLCDVAERTGTIRGIPPVVVGTPVLTATPSAVIDEGTAEDPRPIPRVRAGAVITVDIATVDSIVPTASQITLSGTPLTWDADAGVFQVELLGNEADGLKTLDARLIDAAGNETRESWPGVVRFDFTPPVGDCVLQPALANGDQPVTFDVFVSEELRIPPDVTSDEPGVEAEFLFTSGNQHRFRVEGTDGEDLAYVFTVIGEDLAGNPQVGDTFCDLEDRMGEIHARRPVLVDATVDASPALPEGDHLVVRRGATVTVVVETLEDIDVGRSSVSLSGLELAPVTADTDADTRTTWQALVDPAGDGPKDLRLRLVDAAGNVTEPPVEPAVIRFDFTPPVADCVLTPALAHGGSTITFDVFASEALGAPPDVTSSTPKVTATYDPTASTGNQHRYRILGTADENHAYDLLVTAADLVGNPQAGTSLCTPTSRAGQIVGRGPQLVDLDLDVSPHVEADGLLWGGKDDVVRVTFTTVEAIDPTTTTVTLSGSPLTHESGTTWMRRLTGDEGDGPKSLDASVRDPAGNTLRVTRADVFRFDFTPPTASCVLALTPVSAAQATAGVGFEVRANERLAERPDVVATTTAPVTLAVDGTGTPPVDGRLWTYAVSAPTPGDADYVLAVEAVDLVGNTSTDDAFCPAANRTGRIDASAPTPTSTPQVDVVGDAFVRVGGLRTVRRDAALIATVHPSEPIVVAASSVTLSGVPLTHQAGTDTWTTTLTGLEGDGPKTLQYRLVDAVGNATTGEVAEDPGTLRFDFTAPTATCLLTPAEANAAQATAGIRFELRASEALAGTPDLAPTGVVASFVDHSEDARDWTWSLVRSPATDGPYTLGVAVSDLVGNQAVDDAVCPGVDREGRVIATPPGLTVDPVLEVETGAAFASPPLAEVSDPPVTVRAGVTLRVRFTASASADVPASQVSLSGLPLAYEAGTDSWWVALDGDEGDGVKDLRIQLVDTVGNTAVFTFPAFVAFDFLPPSATCLLLPSEANTQDQVTFEVIATEPLLAAPTVTPMRGPALEPAVEVELLGSSGTHAWLYAVDLAAPANVVGYELQVDGTDLAGNPDGGQLCSGALRPAGSIYGVRPELSEPPGISIRTEPVTAGPVPTVRRGSSVFVQVPTTTTIDEGATRVRLSGTPLVSQGNHTWRLDLDGDDLAGEGFLDLTVDLVDPAGNTNSEPIAIPDAVRFDFEEPKAVCRLANDRARRTDVPELTLDLTELLDPDAAPPGVGASGGLWLELTELDAGGGAAVIEAGPIVFDASGREVRVPLAWTGVTPPAVVHYRIVAHGVDLAGNGGAASDLCEDHAIEGWWDLVDPSLAAVEADVAPLASVPAGGATRATFGGPGVTHFEVALCTQEDVHAAGQPVATAVSWGSQVPLAWVSSTQTGAPACPWRSVYAADLDAPVDDGRKDLVIDLADAYGNTRRYVTGDLQGAGGTIPASGLGGSGPADLVVWADYTPPDVASAALQRLPLFGPAVVDDTTLLVSEVDPITGQTVEASLFLVATEGLGATPQLVVAGPAAFGSPVFSAGSRSATWRSAAAFTSEGSVTFLARLEDLVGNADTVALPVLLTVDRTGPSTVPDVHTEGRIVLRRFPWGDGTPGASLGDGLYGPATRYEVEGKADAATPGATVIVKRGGPGGGDVLAQATVGALGAFGPVLLPFDLADVEVAELDAAGNPGAAAPVRDVEWTATTTGDPDDSPHDFFGTHLDEARREPDPALVDDGPATDPGRWHRDGLTAVTEGRPTWSDETRDGVTPGPRYWAAMAHDPVRAEVVVFGGAAVTGLAFSDTWVWDGARWTPRTQGAHPSPRAYAAMAFHAGSDRVVLVGGGTPAEIDDCWTWDGTTWSKRAGVRPDARLMATMAYDAVRDVLVLFGGATLDTSSYEYEVRADTWEFDGSTWRDVTPGAPGPQARREHAMAWDPGRGRVVLFGGRDQAGALLGDTWEWDGVGWAPRALGSPAPAARYGAAFGPDPARGGLVLHGGVGLVGGDSRALPDTWSLVDGTWTDLSTALQALEDPLNRFSSTWDAARGELLIYGGNAEDENGERLENSTTLWGLHAAGWAPWSVDAPEPRLDAPLAYDAVARQTVLHGGVSESGWLDDTWAWTARGWRRLATSGPGGRSRAGLAYDEVRGRVVLHGGVDEDGAYLGDTWAWDGTTWSQLDVGTPGTRADHALVYHGAAEHLLLFGGNSGSGGVPFPSTTHLLGATGDWTTLSPAGPGFRYHHGAAYDRSTDTVIVFGGQTDGVAFGDTWSWDGGAWTLEDDEAPFGPRIYAALAYDPGRGRTILAGGVDFLTRDDTWVWDDGWVELAPARGLPPVAAHAMATDLDRDRVVLRAYEEVWEWDGGGGSRATHQFAAAFSEANAGEPDIRSVTVRWFAGATGFPSGAPVNGAALRVWDAGAWVEVDQHGAKTSGPAELCWTVLEDASAPGRAGCVEVVDADGPHRLLTGPDRRIHAAVRPVAPNGPGSATDPSRAYGSVSTDYAEVTVRYRRPAP